LLELVSLYGNHDGGQRTSSTHGQDRFLHSLPYFRQSPYAGKTSAPKFQNHSKPCVSSFFHNTTWKARLRVLLLSWGGAVIQRKHHRASTCFPKLDIVRVEIFLNSKLGAGGCQSLFSKFEYINLPFVSLEPWNDKHNHPLPYNLTA
jgi:hypothetical protein